MISKIISLFAQNAKPTRTDEDRPTRAIRTSENSWIMIYADEYQRYRHMQYAATVNDA